MLSFGWFGVEGRWVVLLVRKVVAIWGYLGRLGEVVSFCCISSHYSPDTLQLRSYSCCDLISFASLMRMSHFRLD